MSYVMPTLDCVCFLLLTKAQSTPGTYPMRPVHEEHRTGNTVCRSQYSATVIWIDRVGCGMDGTRVSDRLVHDDDRRQQLTAADVEYIQERTEMICNQCHFIYYLFFSWHFYINTTLLAADTGMVE